MKILFLSSEIAPFFRETGQGDVCEYLTKALKHKNHDVRVIAPRNMGYGMGKYALREIARLKSLVINIKDEQYNCSVKSGFLPGSRAQVYFIEYPELYDRKELYQDPATGKPWEDNLLRFSFLNHAALQLLLHLQWLPDVIHCMDWRMSFVPYIINHHSEYKEHFAATRAILQMHDFHQLDVFTNNNYSKELLVKGDIPKKFVQAGSGQTAWLTTGISCADKLVSLGIDTLDDIFKSHSKNIDPPEISSNRKGEIHSIPFGIDCKNWNPATDKHIAHRYNIDNFFDTKSDNKSVLREAVNLADQEDMPIIAIICTTADQQALDLIKNSLQSLLEINSQYIIVGEHDYNWKGILSETDAADDRIISVNDPTDKLKHQIIAGSDILLIPSTEHCGSLNQMHGLRYGTIPIVFSDKNVTNSIIDGDDDSYDGNGIIYREYSPEAIFISIKKALHLHESKDLWYNVQSNAMSLDLNWINSVNALIEIYRQAKENPKYDS